MKKFRKMILLLVATLLIVSASLNVFAPHPPATPNQVKDMTKMEAYFNRLIDSGIPPVYDPRIAAIIAMSSVAIVTFLWGSSTLAQYRFAPSSQQSVKK